MRAMIGRAMGQASGGARETGVLEGAEGLMVVLRKLVDYSAHQSDRIDDVGGRVDAQSRALEGQSVRLAALVRARKETSEGLLALADRITLLEERAGAAEREAMALAAANRRLIRLLQGDGQRRGDAGQRQVTRDAPGPVETAPRPSSSLTPSGLPASSKASASHQPALDRLGATAQPSGALAEASKKAPDPQALGRALRALATERSRMLGLSEPGSDRGRGDASDAAGMPWAS
ncbi:MAG: hypothetical protein AAFW01_10280 [Pseudomonadota bacterium]